MSVISRIITYAKAAMTPAQRAENPPGLVAISADETTLIFPSGSTAPVAAGAVSATSVTASGAVQGATVVSTGVTTATDGLVLPKASGKGIKVDPAAPTFGWKDLMGQIITHGVPATDPSYNVFRGNNRAYQFSVNDFVEIVFHIPHDYVPGTDLYAHIHWAHASAGVASGAVNWEFESMYAKGHNQAAFPASKTVNVPQNASTTQYQHMIAEAQISSNGGSATLLDSNLLEPDGILLVRMRLTSNTMTGTPEPYAFMADIHYQTMSAAGTKQKAPNFYA